jgi:catechol 2,3-dioxygenase-like lactoylglutathione lyase family enzyme
MHQPRIALHGIHHVAVSTADAAAAAGLYGEVLGLHALDPALALETHPGVAGAFGDRLARPGALVHLIEAPSGRRGRPGRGAAHEIAWRVANADALSFWQQRLTGVGLSARRDEGGLDTLPSVCFRDPEGLDHRLVIDTSGDEPLLCERPGIPAEVGLRGIDGIAATGRDWTSSADLLAGRLDFSTPRAGWFTVAGRRRAHYTYSDPSVERAVEGGGLIHHVAWACDSQHLPTWRERVIGLGARVSGIHHADGFSSIHFREPAGVRFEIISPAPIESASERPTEELRALA